MSLTSNNHVPAPPTASQPSTLTTTATVLGGVQHATVRPRELAPLAALQPSTTDASTAHTLRDDELELAVALQEQADKRAAAASESGIPALTLRRPSDRVERPRDILDTNELDDHEFGTTAEGDDKTGVAGLETMDFEGETVRLYRQTKLLLSKALVDKSIPVNQKTSVANALANQLKALAALQTDIYNAERLKRLEAIIVRMVKTLDETTAEQFLLDYEREVNVR